MKSTWTRMTGFAVVAVSAMLAFAGCGGHDRDRGESRDSGNGSQNDSLPPAFDPTGDWGTSMDSTALGTTSFKMDENGKLSGQMVTDTGESGNIDGALAGTDAEYTVKFHDRSYLVTLGFNSVHTSGTGTMVDADGHSHSLKLSKK